MSLTPEAAAPAPWTLHIDGSALPNPGRMAWGAVLVAPDGGRHTLSESSPRVGCNNEAEVLALMAALRQARSLGAQTLSIYTDSSILVEQLGPRAARPIVRLQALFEAARQQLQQFAAVELRWVPRHRNTEADALARAAHQLPAAS